MPGSTEEIQFHRHCQKTVCSAYSNGQGATWNTINLLSSSLNLPNLDEKPWIESFQSCNNITDDLAVILKLINQIYQNSQPSTLTVSYYDADAEKRDLGESFEFRTGINADPKIKLGRYIEATIEGEDLCFHTMKSEIRGCPDSLDITLNNVVHKDGDENIAGKKTFTSVAIGTTPDANANGNQLVTAAWVKNNVDYCYIPSKGSNASNPIPISKNKYVYHIWDSDDYTPIIDIKNYNSIITELEKGSDGIGSAILQFEIHIHNGSGTTTTTRNINFDGIRVKNDEIIIFIDNDNKVPLTDVNTVQPGETNAYVFRINMQWDGTMNGDRGGIQYKLIWSLAYIY